MVFSVPWVRRQVAPIAIDLGQRVVRMLQVARQRSHITLLRYAQRELPITAAGPDELEQMQAEAVADMLAHEGFIGRDAITCLPWSDLTIRNLRIPSVPNSQLEDTVLAEAASQMGLDVQATDVRFLPAGDVRQATTIGQEVLVLAVERAAVESHIRRIESMDLAPVGIDAPPCAAFRCFERFLRRDQDQDTTSAFLEIGYTGARVMVASGDDLIFIKTIPVGGLAFDELVSQQMELTPADTARLRVRLHRYHAASMTGGPRPPAEVDRISDSMRRAMLDAIRPAVEHLGQEVAQSLRYCAATFRGQKVAAITVVGGEAYDLDMLQLLSDQIDMPFQAGKPLRNISLEPSLQVAERRTGQPEWATVLGMGLKQVRASVVRS